MSTLSVPYNFTPDTTAISGQVDSNFSSIVNFVNSYCAIVNNPNVFTSPININSTGGLTLGSSSVLTPLTVYGSSNFYNSVTVGTSGANQSTTLNGNLAVSGTTTLNGATNLNGQATVSSDPLGTSGFNGGVKWPFPSGTRILFQQASAPVGWTQDTTVQNDSLLRMVNGAGGGVYTGVGYSTVMHGNATSDGTAISQAQLPNCGFPVSDPGHTHGVSDPGHLHTFTAYNSVGSASTLPQFYKTNNSYDALLDTPNTGSSTTGIGIDSSTTGVGVSSGGSGTAHTHTLSALNVNSIDIIVGIKQ